MKIRIIALVGFVALLATGTASAQGTDTATLNVTATVVEAAQITAVGDIDFGNYDPTSATATDAAGSVTVRATAGLSCSIYIGNDRSMTDGTDTLNYELYSDAGRTAVWGDTDVTGVPYNAVTNAETLFPIFGRVAALQNVGPNVYNDTVTITLEW